jgi:hypothetical protein
MKGGSMRYKICLLLLFALILTGMQAQNQTRQAHLIETSVEDYVVKAFLYNRTSGSLVLTGACKRGPEGDGVATDEIKILEPSAIRDPSESLDRLAKLYPHIKWSRRGDGLVQVRDDRTSASTLGVSLGHVELRNVVSVEDGLKQVLSAPEIKVFLDRNHTEMPVLVTSSTMSNEEYDRRMKTTATAQKYSQTLTALTLEDALNSVVRAFPGIWVYSECPGRITITAYRTRSLR